MESTNDINRNNANTTGAAAAGADNESRKSTLRQTIRISVGIDMAISVILSGLIFLFGVAVTLAHEKPKNDTNSSSTSTTPSTTSSSTSTKSTPSKEEYEELGSTLICISIAFLVAKMASTALFFISTMKSKNDQLPFRSMNIAVAGWFVTLIAHGGMSICLFLIGSAAPKTTFGVLFICTGIYLILMVILLTVVVWLFAKELKKNPPALVPVYAVTTYSVVVLQAQPSVTPSKKEEQSAAVAGE